MPADLPMSLVLFYIKCQTGAEAKEKFKDLPERARNFDNINH